LFYLSGLEASADLAVLSVAVAVVGYKDKVQKRLDSVYNYSLIGHAVTQTFCIKISCLIWYFLSARLHMPIDPMHKWLAIKNSFVTNHVFELIIQKKFYSQTRLVGLI